MTESQKNLGKSIKIMKIIKFKVNKISNNRYKFPINKANSQNKSFNNKIKVHK